MDLPRPLTEPLSNRVVKTNTIYKEREREREHDSVGRTEAATFVLRLALFIGDCFFVSSFLFCFLYGCELRNLPEGALFHVTLSRHKGTAFPTPK